MLFNYKNQYYNIMVKNHHYIIIVIKSHLSEIALHMNKLIKINHTAEKGHS